jgi:hypothetical protein
LDLIRLRAALNLGRIQWERHVLERLIQRGISREEVIDILSSGKCIEDYPNDQPFPSALFLGWIEGSPLHAVAALDEASSRVYIKLPMNPILSILSLISGRGKRSEEKEIC